jgi:hypothetical protein
VPPVPVAAPPTPAPPEPKRPPVPAPPIPEPVRPPVPFTPPVPGCAVPPLPIVPPWPGAAPVPFAPPVPDCPPPAVVPPGLGTPPVPWVPPVPEAGELFDEQALPRTASTATIERTEHVDVMYASLLAENPSTAAKMNILDSCVRNCNTRELARHIAQPWIMTSKSSRYAKTNQRKPRGIAASGSPCRPPRRLSAGSFRSARAVVVGASTKSAVLAGGLHLHTGIPQMS